MRFTAPSRLWFGDCQLGISGAYFVLTVFCQSPIIINRQGQHALRPPLHQGLCAGSPLIWLIAASTLNSRCWVTNLVALATHAGGARAGVRNVVDAMS